MDDGRFILLATRSLSGEASKEELEELLALVEENPAYKERSVLLEAFWKNENNVDVHVDEAWQKLVSEINHSGSETVTTGIASPSEKSRGFKVAIQISKVAAILLLFIGGIYFIINQVKPHPDSQTVSSNIDWQVKQIPKGIKSTLFLPDGSKVILNADSKLQFPKAFSGSTREVFLKGEAFFDVAHNAEMPFIIHAGKMNIKVLGTEFNVKSYPEDSAYETTLIRGSVEVTLQDRPSDKIILKPKEKLIVSNLAVKPLLADRQTTAHSQLVVTNLHYISQTDSTVVETSWVNNKMIFQNESFEDLALEISRKYAVDIQFSNDGLKKYRFTGIFENETIEEVLNALKLTEKFNYKIEGSTAHIY